MPPPLPVPDLRMGSPFTVKVVDLVERLIEASLNDFGVVSARSPHIENAH
jgi:hypothetical protein